jgi:hypothetical protein
MKKLSSAIVAAAGIAIAGAMAFPAVAAAEPAGPGYSQYWGPPGHPGPPPPGDWYHPEWAGWNNGYPEPGWVPPPGWQAPDDWYNPTGWQPPPGWCGGPVRFVVHPRCW